MHHSHAHAGSPSHESSRACGCGPRRGIERVGHRHWSGDDPSGGFGVRRPLRFLAWKLGLAEPQVEQFAAIINELKTERAQAAVDDRRALTLLADAVQAEGFDAARAEEATKLRAEGQERLQKQVAAALGRMHGLLGPEQRSRLAYLLRTGTLVM